MLPELGLLGHEATRSGPRKLGIAAVTGLAVLLAWRPGADAIRYRGGLQIGERDGIRRCEGFSSLDGCCDGRLTL